jgi:SAM-dependent methyltransferase
MVEKSEWVKITDENPEHSSWYIERFRAKAAAGEDLSGEARMINAMVPKGSRILDAGCGPGRTGGFLADLGHMVTGVDVDPILIAAAGEDHPGPMWLVRDLAELDLAADGIEANFDIIVSAGNVMAFLAASTRREVLSRLGAHLAEDGRLVVGFGSAREYDFADFFTDVDKAGLTADLKLSTWDLRPFNADSEFLVAILRR